MMEKRHQNLAKLLQKNDTWSWLGANAFLGDKTISQYAGLKVFVRYVIDNRASILDNREDRGVDFVASGDNTICRNFIKYLQEKAEKEQDEKKKQQYAWMGNRAEAMLQMKDPSLGQMNDGIFLAHAFTLFKLGEDAKPRIEVNENSITGLLDDGFSQCRKEDPTLGAKIDKIENKPTQTLTPAGIEPASTGQVLPPSKPDSEGGGGVLGYEGGGEPSSYTKKESGTTTVPGKEEGKEKPKPKDKEKSAIPGEETQEPVEPGVTGIPVEGGEAGEPGSISLTGEGGKSAVPGRRTGGKGKADVRGKEKQGFTKPSKFKVISSGGKRKKKKQIGPQKGVEKQKQKPQTVQLPPRPGQGAPVPPRRPMPSGGWKIAKKAGKIIAGSSAGAGTVWAASSAPEATAKVFGFINLFF